MRDLLCDNFKKMKSNLEILNQSWIDWNLQSRDLRYGQYVMNTYFPSIRCRSLFYEQNALKAKEMITNHLLGQKLIEDWIE